MRALAIIPVLLMAACARPVAPVPDEDREDRRPLRLPGWAPENRDRIETFLLERGFHGRGYDAQKPPVAVFDWDMTSIFNDVGDATFDFQLATLSLELTEADLARIVPEKLVTTGASLAAERKEALDAYAKLVGAGLTGVARPWSEKRAALEASPELARAHAVFRYRMQWFYDRLESVDGALVAYPFVARLYARLTPQKVTALVERVLRFELRDPARGERCTRETLVHPDAADWAGSSRAEPIVVARGIVASPEMQELDAALRRHGFSVYVVTASFAGTVAVLASRYGFAPDHVIGIRLATGADGAFTDEVLLPITYRQGKVDNIRAFVPSEPVFAAGDSDTDVEMLTMRSVELRIILDRKKSPTSDIGKLYEKARSSDREHYLIQGRNDYEADGTALGSWNGTTRTP